MPCAGPGLMAHALLQDLPEEGKRPEVLWQGDLHKKCEVDDTCDTPNRQVRVRAKTMLSGGP